MERNQHIHGIFDFVSRNREDISNILTHRIPKKSIVNYGSKDIFSIVTDTMVHCYGYSEVTSLRVQTQEPGDNSSQGHCRVTSEDNISYSNNSDIVMKIILELFVAYKREKVLQKLLGV